LLKPLSTIFQEKKHGSGSNITDNFIYINLESNPQQLRSQTLQWNASWCNPMFIGHYEEYPICWCFFNFI